MLVMKKRTASIRQDAAHHRAQQRADGRDDDEERSGLLGLVELEEAQEAVGLGHHVIEKVLQKL